MYLHFVITVGLGLIDSHLFIYLNSSNECYFPFNLLFVQTDVDDVQI